MTILDVMRNGAPEKIEKLLDKKIGDIQDILHCDECENSDPNFDCYHCLLKWLEAEATK